MKRLLVDATPLVRDNYDGVSRYTKELLEKFERLYSNEYSLHRVGFLDDKAVLEQRIWMPRRIFSGLFKLLSLDLTTRHSLGLYPNFVIFPLRARNSIVVVHDLGYIDRPNEVSLKNRRYIEKFVPKSLKKAKLIIAVSEFTKQQLMNYYEVADSKIVVVPCGIDTARFRKPGLYDLQRASKIYGLPKNYILCFGSIEPRKNLVGALKAYSLLDETTRKKYPLVLAGGGGWLNDDIKKEVTSLRADNQVFVPGYIDELDVPAVYAQAAVLLFPSIYEGFGLPILEAQACEVPVITSNISPMKDIAGGAALLCDPQDPASIADSLEKLLGNPTLVKKLTLDGRKNIRKYSWESSAKLLKRALELV